MKFNKLFEKVKFLLINYQAWKDMSKSAYYNAHDRFSNKKRLQNLIQIYSQMKNEESS